MLPIEVWREERGMAGERQKKKKTDRDSSSKLCRFSAADLCTDFGGISAGTLYSNSAAYEQTLRSQRLHSQQEFGFMTFYLSVPDLLLLQSWSQAQ